MNVVEGLALLFAVIVLIKFVVFLINPRSLPKALEQMFEHIWLWTLVTLALSILVGYYLITALGIVTVIATFWLSHLLVGLAFLQFPKSSLKLAREMLKHRWRLVLVFIFWLVLAVWTLWVLFT